MICEKCGKNFDYPLGAAWCLECVLKEENCYEEEYNYGLQ